MNKKKCIIVVDVQKEYGEWFTYNYLKNLFSYLGKEHKGGTEIISLLEPSVDWDNSKFKEGHLPQFIADISNEYGYKFFSEDLFNGLSSKIYTIPGNPEAYKQAFPVYMTDIFNYIIDKSPNEVYFELVGGGLTKCVEIVYRLLKSKGFEVELNEKMCYHIRIVNSNRHANIFEGKPKLFPKKYKDETEHVRFLGVSNEPLLNFFSERAKTVSKA